MYRVRWDRVLSAVGLLLLPLAVRWLGANTYIGSFYQFPLLGPVACHNPEVKSLILLMLVLISVVMIVKTLRD